MAEKRQAITGAMAKKKAEKMKATIQSDSSLTMTTQENLLEESAGETSNTPIEHVEAIEKSSNESEEKGAENSDSELQDCSEFEGKGNIVSEDASSAEVSGTEKEGPTDNNDKSRADISQNETEEKRECHLTQVDDIGGKLTIADVVVESRADISQNETEEKREGHSTQVDDTDGKLTIADVVVEEPVTLASNLEDGIKQDEESGGEVVLMIKDDDNGSDFPANTNREGLLDKVDALVQSTPKTSDENADLTVTDVSPKKPKLKTDVQIDDLDFGDGPLKKGTKPGIWLRHYRQLVAFKDSNDHCRVPCKYKDNKRLGSW